MRKNFLFAAVAAICVLGAGGAAFAADSTAELMSSLRARGFNDNEIAVYKSQHPDQFITVTATPGTVASTGVVKKPANVTYAMNTAAARSVTQAHASAVLAALKKNGYNLQELILYMKEHPEIFPPNVDPNTKRLVTNTVPNTTKVQQVTPVKAATTAPQVVAKPPVVTPVATTAGTVRESEADIVARLKANGFNANEIAYYKAQHPDQFPSLTATTVFTPAVGGGVSTTGLVPATSSGTPAVVAINQSLATVAQLRARGFNDAEIKTYYSTH